MTAELPSVFSRIPWVPPTFKGGMIHDIFGRRVRGHVHGDEGRPDSELNGRRRKSILRSSSGRASSRLCSAPASISP
jgi:hypothetical protein